MATLQSFFKAAGFKVFTLTERAAECPLAMKGHFFFNAWTMAEMLAGVLANLETDVDLILLDRGFLDALIWLELQVTRQQVSEEEKRVFTEFVLMPRWRRLVDFSIVMQARPEVALQRENAALLIPRQGTLMNERALAELNAAISRTLHEHETSFRSHLIDTSDAKGVLDSCTRILEVALPVLEEWANPRVAVIRRSDVAEVFGGRLFFNCPEAPGALERLAQRGFLTERVLAERDVELLQLVVGGVPCKKNGEVLVFHRDRGDEKSTSYGRTTLWKGCHVQVEPGALAGASLTDVLVERLQQDLHLQIKLSPELLGIAAPMRNDGSDASVRRHRHVGILYRVQLTDAVAQTLHAKEFRRSGRSHPFTGQFRSQEDIIEKADELELEPWSRYLVENVRIDA